MSISNCVFPTPPEIKEVSLCVLGFRGESDPDSPIGKYFVSGINAETGDQTECRCMYHDFVKILPLWFNPKWGVRPLAVKFTFREDHDIAIAWEEMVF